MEAAPAAAAAAVPAGLVGVSANVIRFFDRVGDKGDGAGRLNGVPAEVATAWPAVGRRGEDLLETELAMEGRPEAEFCLLEAPTDPFDFDFASVTAGDAADGKITNKGSGGGRSQSEVAEL